jgi:O-antigen ligase
MFGLASAHARRAMAAAFLAAAGVLGIGAVVGLPTSITDRLGVLFENFGIFDVRTVDVDATNWSVVERMAHWQAGWSMALDHPWLGVGPGNFEANYDNYYLPGWPFALGHAHNFYLNTFAEMGIVGLLAFVGLTVTIFVRISHAIRVSAAGPSLRRGLCLGALAALTAFSIHNVFDNMLVHGMAVQIGLILGLVEGAIRARQGLEPLAGDGA